MIITPIQTFQAHGLLPPLPTTPGHAADHPLALLRSQAAPEIALTPRALRVGPVLLPRPHGTGGTTTPPPPPATPAAVQGALACLNTSPTLWRPLVSLARCVRQGWPCLLVAPGHAPAARAVRALATLLGSGSGDTGDEGDVVVLDELPMTPATDVSELLGSFEQVRKFDVTPFSRCRF